MIRSRPYSNATQLLASKLGASSTALLQIQTEVNDRNSRARSIYDETASFLTGFAKSTALVALARGAPDASVNGLLAEMQQNDANSTSIPREEAVILKAIDRLRLPLSASG